MVDLPSALTIACSQPNALELGTGLVPLITSFGRPMRAVIGTRLRAPRLGVIAEPPHPVPAVRQSRHGGRVPKG